LLLITALAASWAVWAIFPPRPIRSWTIPFEGKDTECPAPDGAYVARVFDTAWDGRLHDWQVGLCRAEIAKGVKAAGYFPGLQPPGKHFVVSRHNDSINVFGPDGQVELTTPPHRTLGPVCPDGRYFIVTANDDGPVAEVWDVSTGTVRASLREARAPIALSDDNKTVATSLFYSNNPIGIWDVTTGRQILVLGDKKDPIPGALALSPIGRLLATWPASNSENRSIDVALWNTSNGKRIACLPFQPTRATPVILEFSPSDRVLVARGETVCDCWDLSTDPPRSLEEIIAGSPNPFSVHWFGPHHPIFSRNHRRLIIPKVSGEITSWVIYDAESFAKIGEFVWRNTSDAWPSFSEDGRWLAGHYQNTTIPAAGWEAWLERKIGQTLPWKKSAGYLRLFDLTTGLEVQDLPVGVSAIGFDSDSQSFWSYSEIVERNRMTGFQIFQTPLPSWRPPLWLVAITAAGLLLLVIDWRRGRVGRVGPKTSSDRGNVESRPGLPGLPGVAGSRPAVYGG
jgi:WD40 repeat protein